ncbi:acetyl-CoA synthetase-like protein [Ophiobolus disseminans]|uniref:Acetyl-CoA synthetase-like protein n=1 Tax=Ophiobolus disseminans TaxID=1469910 RepID=A0A6A6ZV00_9PLEO|nr:acetyl-CoA synthetase-like protein [Ophiobolus disseminans]
MSNTEVASLVRGPTNLPLWHKTIGGLLEEQAQRHEGRTALVVPWQSIRCSFRDLQTRSEVTARALLAAGLQGGDMVAIMAGNRVEYIDFMLGAARVGCPLIVLNNTYTPSELISALERTSTKVLLIASSISRRSMTSHIEGTHQVQAAGRLRHLKQIVVLPPTKQSSRSLTVMEYHNFLESGDDVSNKELQAAEEKVKDTDVVNVQFTSGTTGLPKAALLTHRNILNNGRFVGTRMHLTSTDIICCPPPLFHCFGLVMGFLNTLSHGASIVFPSDSFDASLTLNAIAAERCTALLGVPTMFIAQLEKLASKPYQITSLRVGLASGAPVPISLQERLSRDMGISDVLIAYGMTEVSPVSTMMDVGDPKERKRGGLGTPLPHNTIKIVNEENSIVPRGTRGEICSSGYALMRGYLDNPEATNQAMRRDGEGVLWMYTGDEGYIDEEGYAQITGRIKDMIIRGGENIFPAEIEERLLQHPVVAEVSVVGLPDDRYGEVVSAFIRLSEGEKKPMIADVQRWVGDTLGRHKVPVHVYWIGQHGVADDFPKTGSGKHQKHILRDIGRKLLQKQGDEGKIQERARL